MSVRFVRFPEIENIEERTMLEYAWLERQQNEEQKKNQQSYIDLGALPDEIVKPAVLWVHYQGLSVLPSDRHIYLQTVSCENEDGEIEIIALQPKVQYAGEIYLAVHGEDARYNAVEMLIDGKRLGAESIDRVPFGLESKITIRVIDKMNKARSLTSSVSNCLEHGLKYSPTLSRFKRNLDEFWKGYLKYKEGDQKQFNPWYADLLSMCAKTVWRKLDNADKITAYSSEYLEEVRDAAVVTQALPDVKINMLTGDTQEQLPAETKDCPSEESEQIKLPLTEGEVIELSQEVDDEDIEI